MITGDYLKTAIAIAKNINILNRKTFVEGNGEATDCNALRPVKDGPYLSHEEIDELTKKTSVFARAKPEDKLEIVKSLQRQGWVCAMTGDGVNDAPALQKADIGVAMGLEGTEVAKGASDMILTDDNFCSIVRAIEKGRIIYAGIQKFVSFIMSVHLRGSDADLPLHRLQDSRHASAAADSQPHPRHRSAPSIALGFEAGGGDDDEALAPPQDAARRLALDVARYRRQRHDPHRLHLLHLHARALGLRRRVHHRGHLRYHPRALRHLAQGRDRPTLKIDCGLWTACSSDSSSDIYHAGCADYENTFSTELAMSDEAALCQRRHHRHHWRHRSHLHCPRKPRLRICIETSIRRARTAAFISLVWAENFRAYCSRSFDNPVWVNTFANPTMNKAILFAQVALYVAPGSRASTRCSACTSTRSTVSAGSSPSSEPSRASLLRAVQVHRGQVGPARGALWL